MKAGLSQKYTLLFGNFRERNKGKEYYKENQNGLRQVVNNRSITKEISEILKQNYCKECRAKVEISGKQMSIKKVKFEDKNV